jgi:hypothetical protein
MLPNYTSAGFLPTGDHHAEWSEFVARYGNGDRRQKLLKPIQQILNLLGKAGCTEVRIGGSFVTTKPVPGDFDGVWALDGVDMDRLPLELIASIDAQPDIFGGAIIPMNWHYTDICDFDKALETNKEGAPVGIVTLNPADVPIAKPMDRYKRFFEPATADSI